MEKKIILFVLLLVFSESLNMFGATYFEIQHEGVRMKFVEVYENSMQVYVGNANSTVAINTSTQGTVAIPSKVIQNNKEYTVVGIMDKAFLDCTEIDNVIIPETVTSIGGCAFKGCSSLQSINLPRHLSVIQSELFKDCINLHDVIIPESVTRILDGAFYNCKSLTTITLPKEIVSIGNHAFHDCSGLTTINFPEKVESIGSAAFVNCSNLTTIVLPGNITEISDNLFSGCSKLISILIPNSVTSIGNKAFKGCSGLASIIIPENVLTIGEYAFCATMSLKTIALPTSVTSIGKSAFASSSLKEIFLNDGLAEIGEGAFSNCDSLLEVSIPESVVSLGKNAFYECKNIEKAYVGASAIGSQAFILCTNLSLISFSSTVNEIGKSAFAYCSNLKEIYADMQDPPRIYGAFPRISSDVILYVPYGRKKAYMDKNSDWYYDFEASHVFEQMPKIGNYFTASIINSHKDQSVEFTVTNTTPNEAQVGINSLPILPAETTGDIVIPSEVSGYDGTVFKVTGICNSAFAECMISTVILAEGIETVEDNSFSNCSELSSIVIPRSVKNIGLAFNGCEKLEKVIASWRKPSEASISNGCFDDHPSLSSLYVPAGTKELYEQIDTWRKFSQIIESSPISTGDISARYGSKAVLPIYLRNDEEIAGAQFKLTLPEGVSVSEKAGELITLTTNRTEGMTIMGRKDPDADNSYLFVLLSLDGNPIFGDEGAIMKVKLDIASDLALGDYEIKLEDVYLTTSNFETLNPAEATSDLTIKDFLLGDVNGEGNVNVTDAIGVVNYILHNTPTTFIEGAADINGDGIVNVTDAIGIVNMILNLNSTAAARGTIESMIEPQ